METYRMAGMEKELEAKDRKVKELARSRDYWRNRFGEVTEQAVRLDVRTGELETELQYLKDCETTWIKMCERKGKNIENLKAEMARLNRHISMQNLTISKMKNELDGIPETTPYSNTAKLGQNNFEIIASGKVSGE